MMRRGELKERDISLKYQGHVAVLVSPLLLRRIGAGQVDYCFVKEKTLYVLECKSSLAGVDAYRQSQAKRVSNSANFLASVTGLETQVLLV